MEQQHVRKTRVSISFLHRYSKFILINCWYDLDAVICWPWGGKKATWQIQKVCLNTERGQKAKNYFKSSLYLKGCSRKIVSFKESASSCFCSFDAGQNYIRWQHNPTSLSTSKCLARGRAASVTGWYGLHFVKRPCTPLVFYACQSNTVMTASTTSFPNKTQISLWWLRSLTLLHTSHPLMILTNPVSGGVEVGVESSIYWSSVVLGLFLCFLGWVWGGWVFPPALTATEYNCNESVPLRQCDLLLALICVWAQRFKLLHEKFIPGSGDLTAHRLFVVTIPSAQIVGAALFSNMMEMCWTNLP